MKKFIKRALISVVGIFALIVALGIAIQTFDPEGTKKRAAERAAKNAAEKLEKETIKAKEAKAEKVTHSPDPTPVPKPSKDPQVCLELANKSGSYDEYSTTITGIIKNNCGQSFKYVHVTFKLFDGTGNVVGTALANQNNLESGETWKFKAQGFAVAKSYKMDEITAF